MKLAAVVAVFLYASLGLAEPAFEGYFRFLLGGQHRGYVIQKFEMDPKKKEISHIYFVYVKTPSGVTNESLAAKSNDKFEPISYSYSAMVDGRPKAVDATFKGKKMTATITENGKTVTRKLDEPKGSFLASFLNYLLMNKGLSIGKGYTYNALSEEDPQYHKGTAAILAEESYAGVKGYKIKFNYKETEFLGYITAKGEILGTDSPLQDAKTILVASREEAVGSFPFPEKTIKTLFGGIPAGVKNPLNESKALPSPVNPPVKAQPLQSGDDQKNDS